MAIIMLVAGVITVIFHKFKQPVVLGYLLAGIIVGPHTPPIELVHDTHTINILAELGVVFLMFSLGLEFSLKKLVKVGANAIIAALCETSLMITLGYNLGHYFGWSQMDCIFLGAMLAISSTTIIVKALGEMGLKQHKFAQLIFGILIIEDILAIAIIALLSGIATSGTITSQQIFSTVGALSLFIIVVLVIGILTIPRLLSYVARFKSNEMMLISVLGLCFGFCLMVIALNYSLALGAFLIGAIIAEARPLHLIEQLIEPIRDMFCAIFFVTIGMLFNPQILIKNLGIILIICVVLVVGKIVGCTCGTFISGQKLRTSLQVGMGLAQIGEFSFIIASLGNELNVTSNLLYPIGIAVSAITTLLTPYLIKLAPPVAQLIAIILPKPLLHLTHTYTAWIREIRPTGDSALLVKIIVRISLQIMVNCALVAAVFIAGAFLITHVDIELRSITKFITDEQIHRTLICGGALLISLPFIIAAYRKLKALAMILAELWISDKFGGKHIYLVRRLIFELIPIISIVGIMSIIFSISTHIIPKPALLSLLISLSLILAYLLQKPLVKLQSWLQIRLFAVLEENPDPN